MSPDETEARNEWLAWRKLGIGASDVAALCGMSPYASPMSVYMDKLGLVPPDEDNEYMEYGWRAEPMLTDYFEDRTGLFVVDQQARCVHPEFPHHRATLDGRVCDHPDGDPIGIVEYKTAERGTDKTWAEAIPDAYQIQIQWQMHVDQKERAWLGAMHGRLFRWYPIDRDQPSIDRLVQMVDIFWNKHVLAEQPPPADAHKATTAALAAAYPEPVEGEAAPLDDLQWALDLREQAKAKASDAKVELARADNAIKAAIGGAEFGTVEGERVISYSQIHRTGYTVQPKSYRQLRSIGGRS